MPRITIEIPKTFVFETEMPVLIRDVNYGNHLGHDFLVSFTSEARLRFFKSMGFLSEMDVGGLGIVVADLAVVYKSEGFYGDLIRIEIAALDFNKYGCDLVYQLTNKATGNVIAHAKTGIVFFDYATRKLAPCPTVFVDQLARIPATPL